MLAITRRPAEAVLIGSDIRVIILAAQDRNVRFGVEAPARLEVLSERLEGPRIYPVRQGSEQRRTCALDCRPGHGLWIGNCI